MLELLELLFGTADSVDTLFSEKNKSNVRQLPLWLRLVFFILIYGSALLVGIAGGFSAWQESHIVGAIAYWAFALILILFLIFIIFKIIKFNMIKRNKKQ